MMIKDPSEGTTGSHSLDECNVEEWVNIRAIARENFATSKWPAGAVESTRCLSLEAS